MTKAFSKPRFFRRLSHSCASLRSADLSNLKYCIFNVSPTRPRRYNFKTLLVARKTTDWARKSPINVERTQVTFLVTYLVGCGPKVHLREKNGEPRG